VSAPPGLLGVVVWVLCAVSALAVLGAAAGALLLRTVAERLHLVTLVTSVVALLAATAPALQTGIARVEREGPGG
jgi:multisubunit Na+/H+ antiporter MnhG subunit